MRCIQQAQPALYIQVSRHNYTKYLTHKLLWNMSGCDSCCNPAAKYPVLHPSGFTGRPVNDNRRRENRRPRFYSPRLERASEILHAPTTIRLRELAFIAFALFALWHAYISAERLYDILARRDVSLVCKGISALQCLHFHLWVCLLAAFDWASIVVPWGIVGAIVVFIGEGLLGTA